MLTKVKGLTKSLIFAVLSVGLGSSFLYGYNIGVINAPQTVMGQWIRDIHCQELWNKNDTSTSHSLEQRDAQRHLWCKELSPKERQYMFKHNSKLNIIWTVIASLFCVGGLLGALVSNMAVRRFGRRNSLLINNMTGIAGAAMLALPYFANSYQMLMVGRLIAGFNGGLTSAVAPLYMTEIPPLHLRGTLGGFHQFFIVLAILISQILGHPLILGSCSRWPWLFGLGLLPCIFQLMTLPFCPESPKSLYLDKDREDKAQKALRRLRGSQQYEEELDELREEQARTKDDPSVHILGLFRDPFLRSVTIIAMFISSSGQFSGHGTVIYYSTAVFKSAGLAEGAAIYATIGMGCVYAVSTFITAGMVEKAGRKKLMLVGLGGMCLVTCLLTVFMALFEHADKSADGTLIDYSWTPYVSMVCIFIHTILYSVGPGTIPAFFVSEMFTQEPRSAATSVALATNWISSLIVVLTFPLIQAQLGAYTFCIFAVLLALYFIYSCYKLPETRGKDTNQVLSELREKNGFCKDRQPSDNL